MIKDQYGQLVYSEDDVCDLLMQGRTSAEFSGILVDREVDIASAINILETVPNLIQYQFSEQSIEEFDQQCQAEWYMPNEYKNLDIAEYILGLCSTQEQLQRVGEELLLFQERDLFDLLRYLKYLVDVMTENHVIWGVGRGSSVASYVLYLLGVHKIDSMYYDLDPREFLR